MKKVMPAPELDVSYLQEKTKDDYYKIFPGRLCFKEIYLTAKIFSRPFHPIILQVIAFIHAFLPIIINLAEDFFIEGRDEFKDARYYSPYFWAYTACCLITNMTIYYVNLLFIQIGILDMNRRLIG